MVSTLTITTTICICIGICEDSVGYRIFSKSEISYHHKNRKFYIEQDGFSCQLVQMNPQNQVNYKLTLKLSELLDISLIEQELNSKQ